jgi:hypothetical protein
MHWSFKKNDFFNFLCPHFKSRPNSRCPPCVLGGWGTHCWETLWGSTPLGHVQVFFPQFFEV